MNQPRARAVVRITIVFAMACCLATFVAGCTPDDESMIADAIISTAIDSMAAFIELALSFTRQGLAAFLF